MAKRDENDRINGLILASLGLDPASDISSLDAFYTREFRRRKYMHFFAHRPPRNLPEPPPFLFEYLPRPEGGPKCAPMRPSLRRFGRRG